MFLSGLIGRGDNNILARPYATCGPASALLHSYTGVSMNVHKAARQILAMPELPELNTGLCDAIPRAVGISTHESKWLKLHYGCGSFMPKISGGYLPEPGVWTEQRLNAICLLAMSDAEDFEQAGPTEAEMLVAAGFTPEEANKAVKARIESDWCYGPWDGDMPVDTWLIDAFSWTYAGGFNYWDAIYVRLL